MVAMFEFFLVWAKLFLGLVVLVDLLRQGCSLAFDVGWLGCLLGLIALFFCMMDVGVYFSGVIIMRCLCLRFNWFDVVGGLLCYLVLIYAWRFDFGLFDLI